MNRTIQWVCKGNSTIVLHDGKIIGTFTSSSNTLHNMHETVHIDWNDTTVSLDDICNQYIAHIGKPLKSFCSSEDIHTQEMLKRSGFEKVRECFAVDVTKQQLVQRKHCHFLLSVIQEGEPLYDQACTLLFEHYIHTHEAISPFTGNYIDFYQELPKYVLAYCDENTVSSACFIEENEIAYVVNNNNTHFSDYLYAVCMQLFENYATIALECDTTDSHAMVLLRLFSDVPANSYDTYVNNGK